MRSFDYVIRNPRGLHVRPIMGLEGIGTKSKIMVQKNKSKADLQDLTGMIRLNVLEGDRITVTIEGEDEDYISTEIEMFFENNL